MKKIAKKLGQIPTFYYVIIYITLIVFFAIIYYCLPQRSFYHSTSKFEYSEFNNDANKILSSIKKCILDSNVKHYGDSIIKLNGWMIDLNRIFIGSLNVDNFPKDIGFTMHLLLYNEKGMMTMLSPIIRIDMNEKIILYNKVICTVWYDYKSISFDKEIKTPEISSFFMLDEPVNSSLNPSIVLPTNLWSDIVSFGQGYRGFPTRKVNGQWFRMIYLSAGISTSTLIGDIVPLTVLSRSLVTIQAILTLIVISLFFNALAFDISANLNKSKIKKSKKTT